MTRAPSSVKNAATVLLPAPIPPVSPTTGATIAAVAIPTRAASRGSPGPHAIGARASFPAMKLASRRRRIALPGGGAVSAVVALPPGFRRPGRTPAVILAHGAGSDMTNPFLSSVHAGLAREGLVAVKFNFPYTEARRRAPDPRPAPRGTNGRRRLGGDRRGGGALARRAGRVAGADSLLCARRERGAHEASVVRAQPGDGRRLALGDEAEDLAGLEVVVEAVED